MLKISVIIPTFNESSYICRLLDHLMLTKQHSTEIIVADGGSDDETIACCQKYPDVQVLRCHKKGRACQMIEAVSISKGEIFYFIHADSLPPKNFDSHIIS